MRERGREREEEERRIIKPSIRLQVQYLESRDPRHKSTEGTTISEYIIKIKRMGWVLGLRLVIPALGGGSRRIHTGLGLPWATRISF